MIPKYVKMYVRYRDAANFKNGDFYYWTNEKGYDKEFLEDKLTHLILQESVIPDYYCLPNITPFETTNEFLPNTSELDHPFVEVDYPEFGDAPLGNEEVYGDIHSVIEAIVDKDLLETRIKEAKQYAKAIILESLKNFD